MRSNAKTMNALRNAERRRQAVLDHLHACPGAGFVDIADAIAPHGWKLSELRGTIGWMLNEGEIARDGERDTREYIALVAVTRSAEAVHAAECAERRAEYRARVGPAKRKRREPGERATKPAPQAKPEPWRYVHTPGQSNNRNAGGQGAVRPHVYVNCQQSY